jgi:tRNA 2-thiouridine synthesizing protein A
VHLRRGPTDAAPHLQSAGTPSIAADTSNDSKARHHAPFQGGITMTVAAEELKDLKSDLVVDARATSCPGPILAAKKAIGQIPVGGVMEVLASDTGTLKDLPAWCKKMGHDFLGSVDDAGYLQLFLRKTK